MNAPETIVVALGGNALMHHGEKGTFDEQHHNIEMAVVEVVDSYRKRLQSCSNPWERSTGGCDFTETQDG